MKHAVVFDIDGTISDHAHRVNYAKMKQYKQYYSLMDLDEPIEETVELVKMYKGKGYSVVLLTGRHEEWRKATEDWLYKNGVPYDVLFMRETNDYTKPWEYKKSTYDALIKPHFKTRALFDDDDSVIGQFERMGVRTFKLFREDG